ncbi:flap endonuclease-1 [Candidatus Pacearchaeota archaeon]|nr:flap endonuclease-1 [Candidatus Pacearchaeota archaeon]
MGIQIADIIPRKEIELKDLKGKVVAVDAFNTLYQFLTTIRQSDGAPLADSKGKITSHLSGIFYRNINLLQEGIKLVYVFDGKPPELKFKEIQKRKEAKDIAQEKFEKAKEEGDEGSMRKYSSQTVKMTDEIINESKELLAALGIPVIQAVSEGEAEAALLAKKNLCWASASQDYDSVLYGAPRLIRNLTLSRKRKTSAGLFVDTKIELVESEKVLNELQINQDQMICLGILVGTDYNPGGVKGIGQKRALEIVQKEQYPVKIFEFVEKSDKYTLDFDWQEIFKLFKNFEAQHEEKIEFEKPNFEKIKEILVTKHEFSEERINNALEKLKDLEKAKKQKGLNEFW